jgi:photoactive yellow protein
MTIQSEQEFAPLRVVCAWCSRVTRDGPADALVSHGICATCAAGSGMFAVENVHTLDAAALDALPWGGIRLDASGRVLAYNRAEEDLAGTRRGAVVGLDFFSEVAPCTAVREFGGRYAEMVARRGGPPECFAFVFRFAAGDRLVDISMSYDAARAEGTLLVRAIA